jgi:hypothetical protein
MMKNKPRHEILNDIIKDSKKYPNDWKAAFGKDKKLFSNDYYIFNPTVGIYVLKEYQKNPYRVIGVGSKIARHIDDEIENKFDKNRGDFGIIQGNFKKIVKNIEKGIPARKIFEEGLKGNNLGITIPMKGKISSSERAFNYLQQTYKSKQKKLNEKFEKIALNDGFYSSYG